MSTVPARKSLKVWIPQDFHYRFEWLIKVGHSTSAQDMTDWTATWVITPIETETPWRTYIFPSEADSGVFLNGASGFVDLILKREVVETIPWKQATFELKVVNPLSEEEIVLLAGRLTTATL